MTVDYELDGHIAVITINRPEARNAVNRDVAEGIEAAIDRLEEDDEAWIGILTGARTEKGWIFSAGADLKAMTTDAGGMMTKKGGFAGLVQRERTKPIIAAVDGPALAGGTEIVLACDLVVASRTAVFGIPEVKRNLVAGAGGLFRLGRKLPRNIAMELALTGRLDFPAERAHHFGLVNELCDEGGALDAAKALAGAHHRERAARRAREPPDHHRGGRPARGGRLEAVGRGHGRRCSAPRTSARASPPSPRSGRRSGRVADPSAVRSDHAVVVEELPEARHEQDGRPPRRGAPSGPRRRRRRGGARRARAGGPGSRAPRSGGPAR